MFIQELTAGEPRSVGDVRFEGHVGGQNLASACCAKSSGIEVGVKVKENEIVVMVGGQIRCDGILGTTAPESSTCLGVKGS